MEPIILNDEKFWRWMEGAFKNNDSGISKCVKPISRSYIDPQYIVEMSDYGNLSTTTSIMDKLRKSMPIGYFNEIHYCISVYSSILGRIFPALARDIEQLAYVEWLQFAEPLHEKYRDHFIHIFKVAFVSDLFLSDQLFLTAIASDQATSDHFSKWCKSHNIPLAKWEENNRWPEIIKIAFFIAALFHDSGYGYYHLQEYKQNLCRLYPWLISTDNMTFDIQSKSLMQSLPAFFIKKYHHWLESSSIKARTNNLVLGFFRDCLPINHSIASTLFVLDMAEKVTGARAISPELYTAFHLAAETIMIHDMIDKERWLHLIPHNIDKGQEKKKGKDEDELFHFITPENQKQFPMAISMVLFDQLSRWKSPTLMPECYMDSVNYRWGYQNANDSLKVEMAEQDNSKRFIINADKNREKLKEDLEKELRCVSCPNKLSFLDYDLEVVLNCSFFDGSSAAVSE